MAFAEPLRPSLLFLYGQFLTFFKRHDRALEVFRAVTREAPRHDRAWNCVGFLLAEREQYEAAIEAFEKALAVNGTDAATHFNVAFILQRLGRHEQALASFERAIELNPAIDRAWFGLGLTLVRLGRLEEAAAKLEESARLQPLNPHAGYQLASVLHRLGRRERLQKEYERVKGFDPKVAERIRIEFGVEAK